MQCGFVFDDMSAVRDNRYDLYAVSEKKVLLEPVVRRKLIKETKKGLEKVAGEKETNEKVSLETRQIIKKEFERQIFKLF